VLLSALYTAVQRILQLLLLLFRSTPSKELEIIVLRHELAVLRRHVLRPVFQAADRVFRSAASRLLARANWSAFMVTPATLLRWHRHRGEALDLYASTGSTTRRAGGSSVDRAVCPGESRWGYQRIVGELKGLGVRVSTTTVKKILRVEGLGPTAETARAFMARIPYASRKHPRGGFLHG
jgi:hypothetical protein